MTSVILFPAQEETPSLTLEMLLNDIKGISSWSFINIQILVYRPIEILLNTSVPGHALLWFSLDNQTNI